VKSAKSRRGSKRWIRCLVGLCGRCRLCHGWIAVGRWGWVGEWPGWRRKSFLCCRRVASWGGARGRGAVSPAVAWGECHVVWDGFGRM
jgi:hypothetical protein